MADNSTISKLDKFLSDNIGKISQFTFDSSFPDIFMLFIYLIFILLIILGIVAVIISLISNLNIIGGLLEAIKNVIAPGTLVTYILASCFLGYISSINKSNDLLGNIISVFTNYINILVFLLLAALPSALILSFVEVVDNNFFKTYYEFPLNIIIIVVFFIFIFSLIIFFIKSFKKSKDNNTFFIFFNMSSIILLCISFMTTFKTMTTYLIKNILTYKCVTQPDVDFCSVIVNDKLESRPLLSKLLIVDDVTAKNENQPLYFVFLFVLIIYIILVCFIGFLIFKKAFYPKELSTIVGCKILNKLVNLLKNLGLNSDNEPILKEIETYITKNCNKLSAATSAGSNVVTGGGSKRKIKSKRK